MITLHLVRGRYTPAPPEAPQFQERHSERAGSSTTPQRTPTHPPGLLNTFTHEVGLLPRLCPGQETNESQCLRGPPASDFHGKHHQSGPAPRCHELWIRAFLSSSGRHQNDTVPIRSTTVWGSVPTERGTRHLLLQFSHLERKTMVNMIERFQNIQLDHTRQSVSCQSLPKKKQSLCPHWTFQASLSIPSSLLRATHSEILFLMWNSSDSLLKRMISQPPDPYKASAPGSLPVKRFPFCRKTDLKVLKEVRVNCSSYFVRDSLLEEGG